MKGKPIFALLMCLALCMATTFAAEESAISFTDLDASHPLYESIRAVSDSGLIIGEPDNTFRADETMTRAQLVTILWRMEGCPVVNYLMQYDDVSQEAWYAEAVRWASAEKIVYGDGTNFAPDDPVTREQAAAMLYRYVQNKGGGFVGMWMFPLRYDDAVNVSEWAYEPLCWMTMKGIYPLRTETTLDPTAEATRGEIAVMVHRLAEALAAE